MEYAGVKAEALGERPFTVPLYSSQIPDELAWY
jgi:hypothetical protein